MTYKTIRNLIVLLLLIALPTHAKTLWSDFSLSFLQGSDYEVVQAKQQVVTFEYVNGSTWGDTFMFFDRFMADDGSESTYGEYTSRYKISKLNGFVKNLYVAASVEMGGGNNYLVGIGTDLKVPHFKFVQLNVFHRTNDFTSDNMQATLAWNLPIGPLSYTGFMDYATAVDDNAASMNLTSQLGYNIGPALELSNRFIIGIEYVFWNNKFGIDGVDERNANLLLKFHF